MDDDEYVLFDLIPLPVAVGELLEEALAVGWAARLAWIVVGLIVGLVAVLLGLWLAWT